MTSSIFFSLFLVFSGVKKTPHTVWTTWRQQSTSMFIVSWRHVWSQKSPWDQNPWNHRFFANTECVVLRLDWIKILKNRPNLLFCLKSPTFFFNQLRFENPLVCVGNNRTRNSLSLFKKNVWTVWFCRLQTPKRVFPDVFHMILTDFDSVGLRRTAHGINCMNFSCKLTNESTVCV